MAIVNRSLQESNMPTASGETQQDSRARIVALANLRAMCDRVSGVCHTFRVVNVSRSCVRVEYSNPDEYGNAEPVTALYPCYPSSFPGDRENPRVVLDATRYLGATGRNEESWQAFDVLTDCPELYRNGWGGEWHTEAEIACRALRLVIRSYWADGCYQYYSVETDPEAQQLATRRLFETFEEASAYVVSVYRGARR
jgi:hypothetical protein